MSSASRTISGGSLTIRISPSTRPQSLANARRLSLLRAFARFCWYLLNSAFESLSRNCWSTSYSSSRVYQTDEVAAVPRLLCIASRYDRTTRRTIFLRGLGVELPGPRHDLEARSEALHVPFPRPGQCFVEIIDVEDDRPVGGVAKPPKLTRCASPQICARNSELGVVAQVCCHHRGRTPVERKRRLGHAGVPDWDQLRERWSFACSWSTATGLRRDAGGSHSSWLQAGHCGASPAAALGSFGGSWGGAPTTRVDDMLSPFACREQHCRGRRHCPERRGSTDLLHRPRTAWSMAFGLRSS